MASQYLGGAEDEPFEADERSELSYDDSNDLNQPMMKRLSDYFHTQKRHLCRRYFIYNPVRGRCQPTLMVGSKSSSRKQRDHLISFGF